MLHENGHMRKSFNCSIIIVHLYLVIKRQSPLSFNERKDWFNYQVLMVLSGQIVPFIII